MKTLFDEAEAIEVRLPPSATYPHRSAAWLANPAKGPESRFDGVLSITLQKARRSIGTKIERDEYVAEEQPVECGYAGRRFYILNRDPATPDAYEVFVGEAGASFQCSCPAYVRGRRLCKHVESFRALIEAGVLG